MHTQAPTSCPSASLLTQAYHEAAELEVKVKMTTTPRMRRYIVKQLQASEKRSMQEITPSYFRYLAHVTRKSAPTCLAKIMGIYTVRQTRSKPVEAYVL